MKCSEVFVLKKYLRLAQRVYRDVICCQEVRMVKTFSQRFENAEVFPEGWLVSGMFI